MINNHKIISLARKTLLTEANSITNLAEQLDNNFVDACSLILNCRGKVILTGVGKSGYIARKASATLSSTGSPSFFMHPSEAIHGDIGMVTKDDLIIAISFSGKTEEILSILPSIKLLGVPLISITGNNHSTLAKESDVHLNIFVKKEACTLGIVPTSSTTVTLALADALAVAVLEARGFTNKDFARSHPGGTLGKRLLLRVKNLMRTGNDIPIVTADTSILKSLLEISKKKIGMTLVVDVENTTLGIFTDGDLRRVIDRGIDINKTPILEVMTTNYKTIDQNKLATEAINLMEHHQITSLVVLNENLSSLGVIHMHDLLSSGLI